MEGCMRLARLGLLYKIMMVISVSAAVAEGDVVTGEENCS